MKQGLIDKVKLLVGEAKNASNLLSGAHDTHIWDTGDDHPANGCDYCNGEKALNKAIKEVEKDLQVTK